MDLPATLSQFIAYLAAPAFAAWVVSNFLENEAWFQAQTVQGRSRIILAVYVALGVLSYLLMTTVPTSLITQFQPLYLIISASIAAYISGTAYHSQTTGKTTATISETSVSSIPGGTKQQTATVQSSGSGEAVKVDAPPPDAVPLPPPTIVPTPGSVG